MAEVPQTDRETPPRTRASHLIVDNYATHPIPLALSVWSVRGTRGLVLACNKDEEVDPRGCPSLQNSSVEDPPVAISTTKDYTLSIGGSARYADLLFTKNGNDLVLKIGATDQITTTGYYANTTNRSVNRLQVVIEGHDGLRCGILRCD